jgi:hypothetical protein
MDSYGQTQQVLDATNFLLNTEPDRATWKCGMVTQPICTKVTVFARTPNGAHSEHRSFVKIDRVTIEELFQLIAGVCKIAMAGFQEFLANLNLST